MEPVVVVDGLRVARGGPEVLHGLELSVLPGTVTGLVGPSGSGKSTLLRSIAGIQKVASGSVTILGEPAGSTGNRARVGYLAQGGSIYPDLTVAENVRHFARISGKPVLAVPEVLELVDLGSQSSQLVSTLSGGQRARAALATVLAMEPTVLLLDEPTVGLDPVLRESLWSLFARLANEGRTLVVSSHVMDEAARCDRVLLLREGRLLVDDTPDGIRARTGASDLDEAFLRLATGGS